MNPLRQAIERAFDYRGYVTVVKRDGSEVVGYLYDRGAQHVELLDESASNRFRIHTDEIADVKLTGDDPVAKSQAHWEARKGKLDPSDTPVHGEWAESRPVLVLVALERELREVSRALDLKARGSVARGKDFVAHAVGIGGGAAKAVSEEEPRLVVSFGFCGALEPQLQPGDLVLATSVRDEGGASIEAPAAERARVKQALGGMRVFEGPMVCTTKVATTPEEKRALGKAIAVDMETWPIARAATKAQIPWLCLRAVIDPLEVSLPEFVAEQRKDFVLPALKHVLSGPRGALELAQLAQRARAAGKSLREAARKLMEAQP